MNNKIIDLPVLAQRSSRLRGEGKTLVATNGCFDLLHVGHIRYLQKARALGDMLLVGLNGDDSVRKLKGPERPINNENDRAEVLAALESVDLVVVFPEQRAVRFLEAASPAVYVKGGDYMLQTLDPEERAVLERLGAKIQIIPLEPGHSTSAVIKRLKDQC